MERKASKPFEFQVGRITSFDRAALEKFKIPVSIDGHYITSNGVAHARNHHWSEVKNLRDYEIPVTTEDINRIPEILKAPDEVSAEPYLTAKEKMPVIKYSKVMDNKQYYYLEKYNSYEKRLEMHDMYINKL